MAPHQLNYQLYLKYDIRSLIFFPLENEWVVSHNVSYPFYLWQFVIMDLGTSNPTAKNYSLLRYSVISPDLLHFNYVDWKVSNFDICRWHDFAFMFVCVYFFSFSLRLPKLFIVNWGPWNQDKTWVSDEIACKFHKIT